ncbi:unnamed protein product, partial [Meganyctiphanes norvegica]
MFNKLTKHLGEDIVVISMDGCANIVGFRKFIGKSLKIIAELVANEKRHLIDNPPSHPDTVFTSMLYMTESLTEQERFDKVPMYVDITRDEVNVVEANLYTSENHGEIKARYQDEYGCLPVADAEPGKVIRICLQLLGMHAISGCDIVSYPYSKEITKHGCACKAERKACSSANCTCRKRFSRSDHLKMHASIHNVDPERRDTLLAEARLHDENRRGNKSKQGQPAQFFECQHCELTFNHQFKFNRHMKTHSVEKTYVCFCGASFVKSEDIRRHRSEVHNNCQVDTQFSTISSCFSSVPEINLPMSNTQSMPFSSHLSLALMAQRFQFPNLSASLLDMPSLLNNNIPVTPKESDISSLMNNPSSSVTITQNKSTDCNFNSNIADDMGVATGALVLPYSDSLSVQHSTSISSPTIQQVMLPNIMNKTYNQRKKLIRAANGFFYCEYCNKQFVKGHKLRIHLRIHTGEKPHVCEHCGKRFARRDHMVKHANTHLRHQRNASLYSTLMSVNENSLQKEVCHTSNKCFRLDQKHSCIICSVKFSNLFNLQSHMQIHSEHTSYCCLVCHTEFTEISPYETHILSHEEAAGQTMAEFMAGEMARNNKAQCLICAMWLDSQATLEDHVKEHTNERSFKCTDCNSCFIRKADLDRHSKMTQSQKMDLNKI